MEGARKVLEETRAKLRARTAVPEDHRPALEAIIQLPDEEGARWLSELRREFAFVHGQGA